MSIKLNKFEKQNSEMEALFHELKTNARFYIQNEFETIEDVHDVIDLIKIEMANVDEDEYNESLTVIKFLLKYL